MTPAMSTALDIWQFPSMLSPNATEAERQDQRTKALIRRSLSEDDWARKVAAFNIAMNTISGLGLSPLPASVLANEFSMLEEELEETKDALANNDLILGLDGLLDLIYVALGTAIKLGFSPDQINAAMQEIHASNMSKVDKAGNPVYDANGKVIKSDQYKPADLPTVLNL